jgi:hypothetical protein
MAGKTRHYHTKKIGHGPPVCDELVCYTSILEYTIERQRNKLEK